MPASGASVKITVERPLRLNFAVTDERIRNVRQSTYFETLAISQKRKNKDEIAEEILAGRSRIVPCLKNNWRKPSRILT
jgi:hypothetical protein